MTKVFKNILISLVGLFAFMFAGFFFVGCGVNYDKIYLSSDKASVELEVGESVDITFTIEGYQKGFSNKLKFNPHSDGQAEIFTYSDPIYIGNNQVKVTLEAIAGGTGNLQAVTLEGRKECVVDVSVTQYSSSMEFGNDVLYVSNATDFVPNANLFKFDSNTTNKELSYFYLIPDMEFDYNLFRLADIDLDNKKVTFADGIGNVVGASIMQFDRVKLVEEAIGNVLYLSHNGQDTEIELKSKFPILSVYDYSVNNEDYENIVYCVSDVNVLPSLEVKVSGGYLNMETGYATFEELKGDGNDRITIVPNNSGMVEYVLKLEMTKSIADSPIKMNKFQSNNYVDIDFFDYIEQEVDENGNTVYYLRISQNSQTQTSTSLSLDIFYDIAQGISDESVRVSKDFVVDIEIAPTAITVNGTTEPERITLYNYYRYPEFGWNELWIDVISGYASSPSFEGIYFDFGDYANYIDLIYNNITVSSGQVILYDDLSIPFYIRAKNGIDPGTLIGDMKVKIHVVSDIIEAGTSVTTTLSCSLVAGATAVRVADAYANNRYFYLDIDAGEQSFNAQIYADQRFQFATYRFLSGVDVLSIDTNNDNPYTQVDKNFYLNLTLKPNLTGIGIYRVFLDNGMPIDLTFNVIKTLQEETTEIKLTDEGNEAVTEVSYSRKEDSDFDNVMNLEILNPNSSTFGMTAEFYINANITDAIRFVPNESGFISVTKFNNNYRISTRANGTTEIVFTLTGANVRDFNTVQKEIKLYVNVSSYCLVEEYYLKNGANFALNNTVYFGDSNLKEEDTSVTFTPYVNSKLANNFYRYFFVESAFVDIYKNANYNPETKEYNYTINNTQYETRMVYEAYNDKFLYFYAQDEYGNVKDPTVLEVKVSQEEKIDGVWNIGEVKNIMLIFENGLMFRPEDFVYEIFDEIGDLIAVYTVEFGDNPTYDIGTRGSFDITTFTYKDKFGAYDSLTINSNLRQRNLTRRYDAHIFTERFQSVESISLASSITKLDFSNDKLEYTLGVYTFPTYSTNKSINVEFVRTNNNPFSNMVTWKVDTSESENGVYTITLSCQDFFNSQGEAIVYIEQYLTGKIYIYPSEWGSSYSTIGGNYHAVAIDVQYRNGSKSNPYLLETAEDVAEINSNRSTLKSHYEISTVIDMSTIKGMTPIGILNEKGQNVLVGFSGTIIGSNSQSAITNIIVDNNNLTAVAKATMPNGTELNVLFAGLFAQINQAYSYQFIGENGMTQTRIVTPGMENISFSGRFDVTLKEKARVGLVAGVNKGSLVNIGVKLSASNVTISNQNSLYFGTAVGINYGSILQDFTKYDGTGYIEQEDADGLKYKVDEYGNPLPSSRDYTGQNPKNLVYYNGKLTLNLTNTLAYIGGIAGASSGRIERILPQLEGYKLYGYAGYSAYVMIDVIGQGINSLYVGGAVGALSYFEAGNINSIMPERQLDIAGNPIVSESGNIVSRLLIGGEINTLETVDYIDSVGGIVGISDTVGISRIDILNNISRVFLRSREYVGGIIGFDKYNDSYGAANLTFFGNEKTEGDVTIKEGNTIEAVDDGKNNFFSSAIIKMGTVTESELPAEDNQGEKDIFFAVGNERNNGRAYVDTFDVVSYLIRNRLPVSAEDEIYTNSASTADYYGDYLIVKRNDNSSYQINKTYIFEHRDVSLGLEESEYQMTQRSGGSEDVGVYLLHYFSVDGYISGATASVAQDDIEDLNFVTPSSGFYPFVLNGQDVMISSSSSEILNVDSNGNLTVKGTGLAVINLTSILNVVKTKTIYLYIVNYFDKDTDLSLFYTSNNLNSTNIPNESGVTIYGNSSTSLHLVPTYDLTNAKTYNGDSFSITNNGILNYRNVNYLLSKNSQLGIESEMKNEEGDDYFSATQINKQTIIFYKKVTPTDGEIDKYYLKPMLVVKIKIGTEEYEFIYELEKSSINLNVDYRETATAISTQYNFHSMQTNNVFKDVVTVTSTNEQEVLFYQIVKRVGNMEVVEQSRLPKNIGEVDEANWEKYINYEGEYADTNNEKLFDIKFERRMNGDVPTNVFDYTCRVDTSSKKFINRFEQSIYGEYIVRLYSSELENGVSNSFRILLNEAELNYVSINNYSDINDLASSDEVVVPAQRGVLEISLDPVEAVFNRFTISNNALNQMDGATNASFVLMYEKISEDSSVEYVLANNFGDYLNGVYTFTYQDLLKFYEQLNKQASLDGEKVREYKYNGKFYISYYMPSNNVEDGVNVGFDVNVTYGNEGTTPINSTIFMKTKLGSYVSLKLSDKADLGGVYYVARGLDYALTLDYYGFTEDQITISSSDNFRASVNKVNGQYVLNISPETINYNDPSEPGYRVSFDVYATKTVDNVPITARDTLTIYIMEYVMNYVYVEGVNEDIVKGMEDGVIYTAIGNPFNLQFSIRDFLEYDQSNPIVNEEVDTFVKNMTENITWKVILNGKETTLQEGKIIKNEYYQINSFTVTPLRVYDATNGAYHFSASAYYSMMNGVYSHSITSVNANPIYTEFAFDVHDQSTQDSPIPVETYEDLMNMKDGEYYILLKDIILPSSEYAVENGVEQFQPISANIAGLDGNGYKLYLGGTYNFTGVTNVGLFASVSEGTVLRNVTIKLISDTVFRLTSGTFNVGLIAAENAGIITNCEISAEGEFGLSVICTVTATSSYVAGLVANNTGYITNSRTSINFFSNVNLSGFVGQNSGTISSSYFMGGTLQNETNTTSEYTAGFVISNSGSIHTSYVSGTQAANTMFYDRADNTIQSSNNISGFVYNNSGTVADCYSNIQLRQSGAYASGFVFENTGNVARCFSTSVLESNQTSNYGFARINSGDESTISDCFFLQDEDAYAFVNDVDKVQGVNMSISQINNVEDRVNIMPLSVEEFKNMDNFSNYVITEGRDINGVWFYNDNSSDTSEFGGQVFNIGRLELVSANIIANSKRDLERIENVVDEVTGATSAKYIYVYNLSSAALGSLYNPILIENAEQLEDYILQENNAVGYNYSHYRLISDIDYQEYLYNSKLHKTRFMGYFEGNFMSISGINLISSEKLDSAGLFAELGNSKNLEANGTIMNFTYAPNTVSFANASAVGALVGKVDGGKVLNVDLIAGNSGQNVVVGNNIVGGLVGLAIGDFKMQNITSQISAKARNQDISNYANEFDVNAIDLSYYSFAGGVAGVLSGRNSFVKNVSISDMAISVLAAKAGLMFGLIDENVTVSQLELVMMDNMLVNAYNYGGLIAGESKGTVSQVNIIGTGYSFNNFKRVPFIPNSIGGYTGLMSGGSLTDVSMTQSITVSGQNASDSVKNLGGIAGVITGRASLKDIEVQANLVGFEFVGGVVGTVDVPTNIVEFENVTVINTSLNVLGHRMDRVAMGGLVAVVEEGSTIHLKTSTTDAIEEENSDIDIDIEILQTEIETKQGRLTEILTIIQNDPTKEAELKGEKEEIEKYLAEKIPELNALLEDREKLTENRFEISTAATIYVYGTTIDLYVGGVLGLNASMASHVIFDTYSNIINTTVVNDMSHTFELFTGTVEVIESEGQIILDKNIGQEVGSETWNIVDITEKESYNRTYYGCKVQHTTVAPNEKSPNSYLLHLNLFGKPKLGTV